LREYKDRGLLYYKTDTHWNEYGSFVAYRELMKYLKQNIFPEIDILDFDDFSINNLDCEGGDLSRMIYWSTHVDDVCVRLNPKYERTHVEQEVGFENPNPTRVLVSQHNDEAADRDMLLFRDSFANALALYIPRNFKNTTYVWSYDVQDYIVEEQDADIVILEVLERYIQDLIPLELREK